MKQTTVSLYEKRHRSEPISWLTCYDYSFATVLNSSELDMILVGDSGGMVALGYPDTLPVSMNEMILLASAVRRGAPEKFIVGDMPKGSYEASDYDAVSNAMRFVKEAGCDAVKLEGAGLMAARAYAIVEAGIPVIGHIGLTPQSSAALGGYRVVGRSSEEVNRLHTSMEKLESSGVFGILLEAIPPNTAMELTKKSNSVIFGIGAGKFTHGQLLILHDLLGLYPNFRPKFAKNFIPGVLPKFLAMISSEPEIISFGRNTRRDGLHELALMAVQSYVADVSTGLFPDENYSYKD
jgi:3-methyl-2-oxobutanoate hydroxymethyltransferase